MNKKFKKNYKVKLKKKPKKIRKVIKKGLLYTPHPLPKSHHLSPNVGTAALAMTTASSSPTQL